jgi:hypothetical protein
MEEWKVARELLASFDDRLDNLRKYGFSFLTALLTADSILLPGSVPALADKALSDPVKLAVLVVTLFLIVALQFVDRNYQVFQEAAASRARVLERILNLELTEVISQRYGFDHVHRYVTAVYVAFDIGVGILGSAVFYEDKADVRILVAFELAVALALIAILYLRRFRLGLPHGAVDWTLDRLRSEAGEEVGITVTNLGKEDIRFQKGIVLCEIEDEDGVPFRPLKRGRWKLNAVLTLRHDDSYTWLWNTTGAVPRIYRANRATIKEPPNLIDLLKHEGIMKATLRRVIEGRHEKELLIRKNQICLKPLQRKIRITKHHS